MKNNNLLLIIGQFSLILGFISFILNYFFLDHNLVIALLTGILFGLSIVFNITYLARKKKALK